MLDIQTLVLNFDEEPVLAEDAQIVSSSLSRRAIIVMDQIGANFATQTGRKTDEPFAMLRQELFVDSRLVVKTLKVAMRYEFHQILVSGIVLAKQNQVVVGLFAFGWGAVCVAASRDIDFA